MKRWQVLTVGAAIALAIPAAYWAYPVVAAESVQEVPGSYLYIAEYEFGTGQVINDGIAEAQTWVKAMRETGDFTSVRLFVHHTGPRAAVYILAETDNWQSIETGWEKLTEALPAIMEEPIKWGSHSDNLLSEIVVE